MSRSVFITGASRGIGRAIAVACANRGDRIGIGTNASAEAAAATLREIGERGEIHRLDVCDYAQVDHAITAFSQAGGLDILVVNAGIAPTGILATADPADLRRAIETNTLGPLHCARAALPIMMEKRQGLIVFIGSVASSRPVRGQAAYAASKAGVESLTRSIAVEYGRKGIRALCIRPGAVDTDLLRATRALADDEIVNRIPMKRIAPADEIARAVLMFMGEGASYVNGAVIDVDGGYAAG